MNPKLTVVALVGLLAAGGSAGQTQFMSFVREHLPANAPQTLFAPVSTDLDGDGDQDLILSDDPRPRVWINNGQGVFRDESAARLPVLNRAAGLVLPFDAEGDGDLDLFVSAYGAPCVLLRNDGTGHFTDVTATQLPVLVEQGAVAAAGDVDRDGDPDLVVAQPRSRNRLLLNDGTGRFTDATVGHLPALFTPAQTLELVDLDRDGDLDLVLGGDSNATRVQLNDGAGHFVDVTLSALPLVPLPGRVTIADVDRDGDPDLWIATPSGDRLLINDGRARFSDESTARLPQTGVHSSFVLLRDLDRDGDPDGYLSRIDGDRVYRNDGTGHFTDITAASLPPGGMVSTGAAAADADGDGDLDLVLSYREPRILFGDPSLRFVDGTPRRLPAEYYYDVFPASVAAGDVDRDGDMDLILGNTSGNPAHAYRVVLLRGDGQGRFQDTSDWLPDTSGRNPTAVLLGDLDGDGDLDLVVIALSAEARVLLNDGTGHFSEPNPAALPWMTATDGTLVDVDHDGDLDLVASGGNVRLWLNDGHGVFAEVTAANLPQVSARRIAAGDLDRDGDQDLILVSYQQRIQVLDNDGQGRFSDVSAARIPATNDGTAAVALGDVDGDGDLDLMIGNYYQPGQDRLFLNDGRGVFTEVTATHLPVDADGTSSLAFADLDGDGALDVVVGNRGPLSRIYHNDGSGHFRDITSAVLPDLVRDTWSVLAADLDGDGAADLFFGQEGQDLLYMNHRHRITAPLVPRLGLDYLLDCYATPGSATGAEVVIPLLGQAPAATPIPLPPLGLLRLDPGSLLALDRLAVPSPSGRASVRFTLPADPALAGVTLFAQAAVLFTPALTSWRLTGLLADRIVR